ncbi:MAG: alpha/beta hydrolase [Bdellovibrionales bacterium]
MVFALKLGALGLCLFNFLELTHAETIAPYKDDLFKNGQVFETRDRGAFKRIDYNEMRDINGRDEIPGSKAKPEYVDLAPLKEQREITVNYGENKMETVEVGTPKDAKFAVIFIHGGGGNKTLGANDGTFGGNFNRLKNFATLNQGLYYSPSVTFDEVGSKGVQAIIDRIKSNSPQAKIVVACASAGAAICWSLASDREAASKVSGLVFLGGAMVHPDIENSPAYEKSMPIIFAHGTRDPVVPWKDMNAQFETLRKLNKNYPTRFLLYDSGNHGTPIRMIDWRENLNWIFEQNSGSEITQPEKTVLSPSTGNYDDSARR